ncbi:MAG: DNA polymerase I [Phycisphaerales bacterium]
MPTLYLIDGYAQFFRAYHAIRTPMSSPVTKEPTNMTFGFVGMMLKLLRGQEKRMIEAGGPPDYVAVAIDVSGDKETFRSELYPEYKANRPPPPSDLFVQVDRCLAMLREIGVPIVGAEGFEADDAIATLVSRLRREHPDLRVRIISKDKDLKQLLEGSGAEGRVELYDIHSDTIIDEAALKADTGLAPAQVIDMLALMGDTVDNVPGVPGVGEKTAALLLAQYGTLDNLLAHAAEIKGKRGEKLRESAGLLPLSKRLVTLRYDAPVELDLAAAASAKLNLEPLIARFRELGFNRYQDEVKALLGGAGSSAAPATHAPDHGASKTAPAPAPPPAAKRAAPAPRETPGDGGLFAAVESRRGIDAVPIHAQDGTYTCVTTKKQLEALAARMKKAAVVSIDTETTSLSPLRCKLCGVSVSITPGEGCYIPVRSPTPEKHLDEKAVLGVLRPILEDPAIPKCGHNLKYDMLVLRKHGVEVRGLVEGGRDGGTRGRRDEADQDGWAGCDSMVSSYLIDSSRSSHSLDALAQALLQRRNIAYTDLVGSGVNQRTFDTVPIDLATQYAAEDADVALRLRDSMFPQLRAMGLWDLWADVELPLVEVLAELEWNGILVDPAELDRQRARLQTRIDELAKRLNTESKSAIGRVFNPDSPKQLAAALFNKPDADDEKGGAGLGLKPVKRTQTGYSTDIEVLEKLAADPAVTTPIPALIVEYRQLTKLVGTYLVALKDEINPDTGRIHSSFNQTVAATGRLASSDPNLQNIPIRTDIGRDIRRAFIAPPGSVLISADYSQIELRLLAHLSRDPALIEAFHKGEDIHTTVAAQIHGVKPAEVTRSQRDGAKMVNFGIVYGITPFGLARRLKISEKDAAAIIDGYKRRFAGISTFLEECIAQARRFGYVETMLKRRRPIHDIDDPNPQRRALGERVAINSVVQGSAADLIKVAMVDLFHRFRDGPVKMLLQIHDELVFEAPEGEAEAARRTIVDRMENCMSFAVPIRVDSHAAKNWYEGK